MKRVLYILLLAAGLLACTAVRHPLEERAMKQIALSLDGYLEDYFPGKKDWKMEDLKTVYVNDTVCILQCTAWIRDSLDRTIGRDYKYIYLVDMDFSRAAGKPVFAENFINILCLSDKEIARARRKIRQTRENVYYTWQGGCILVQHPFKE